MTLLMSALTMGIILALLALGVYLSFRIFNIPDMTAEGTVTLGASVAAVMMVHRYNPFLATIVAALAGTTAGAITGTLATKFKINALLSGILVMTGLYSVNLYIMGKSNVPLLETTTLSTYSEHLGTQFFGGAANLNVAGWPVSVRDASILFCISLLTTVICLLLYFFFRTNLGTALRATGDNPHMICALGVSVDGATIFGLALSNGLVGLCGALIAQYQGFADVQMGAGMVVLGIASVIIGESLVGANSVGLLIVGTVMGSILFRLLVAIALRWGLNPNNLKLITAVFVFAALVAPSFARRIRYRRPSHPETTESYAAD